MNGTMTVYYPGTPPERRITTYTKPIPLDDIQQAVGGHIEVVPYWDRFNGVHCVVFCNEEGKLEGLPRNVYMTDKWEAYLKTGGMSRFDKDGNELDFLVGPIALITGDDDFMMEV